MKPDLFLHDLRVALRSLARANVGFAFSRLLGGYIQDVRLPGPLPSFGSIGVILAATVIASVLPAARAARVDVMEALRSE
jgi:putative ABC transport system permease protein